MDISCWKEDKWKDLVRNSDGNWFEFEVTPLFNTIIGGGRVVFHNCEYMSEDVKKNLMELIENGRLRYLGYNYFMELNSNCSLEFSYYNNYPISAKKFLEYEKEEKEKKEKLLGQLFN